MFHINTVKDMWWNKVLPTEESDHVITLISYELNFSSNYASIVKFKSQKVGS